MDSHLPMQREERRVSEQDMLEAILKNHSVLRLALHDSPYPYIVPMNYGYTWTEAGLILYCHMAPGGHREELIEKIQTVRSTSLPFWIAMDISQSREKIMITAASMVLEKLRSSIRIIPNFSKVSTA